MLDKISSWISYFQTGIARIAGVLLMIGLVLAMGNFLLDDAVFTYAPWLKVLWAFSQALAVDSSLAVVFLALGTSIRNKNRAGVVVNGVTGVLLFIVATTITDVEAVRQALNTSLSAAFGLVRIPVLALTFVRALVAVLLVSRSGYYGTETVAPKPAKAKPISPSPVSAHNPIPEIQSVSGPTNGHKTGVKGRLEEYYIITPTASVRQTVRDTGVSKSTVERYRREQHANNDRNSAGVSAAASNEP